MLIAQVTDIHLGFDPDNPSEFNRKRLDQVLRHLTAMTPKPDLLILSGDLVDRGDKASYGRLRNALGGVSFPIKAIPGNHDSRENFIACFPELPVEAGFIQYESEHDSLRFLFLDTLEEGRHGGSFCANRAAWLKARLTEQPDRPTVIVMHHPPVQVGIDWMDAHEEEPWIARFEGAIAGATQIKAILCGHLHRAISAAWNGTIVSVCPSTAPQVALTFGAIDPDVPDGRAMIIADPPGFALHYWNGRDLVTHFDDADEHVLLARYDATTQPLIKSLLAEPLSR